MSEISDWLWANISKALVFTVVVWPATVCVPLMKVSQP